MMKLTVAVFLAVVAVASAGLLGPGPEVYSAVTTKQVHSPFAKSSSTRVQQFNQYSAIVPVVEQQVVAKVAAAPVVAAAAPVVAAAPAYAAAAPVVAAAPAYAAAPVVTKVAAAPIVAAAPAIAAAPVVAAAAAPVAYSTYSTGYGYGGDLGYAGYGYGGDYGYGYSGLSGLSGLYSKY